MFGIAERYRTTRPGVAYLHTDVPTPCTRNFIYHVHQLYQMAQPVSKQRCAASTRKDATTEKEETLEKHWEGRLQMNVAMN